MEESLSKGLESKGYACKGYECELACLEHQIRNLRLTIEELPDLNEEKRIGVINRLSVNKKMIKETFVEKFELGETTLEQYKYWYELTGMRDEFIVVLRKNPQKKIDKLEKLNELIINLSFGNDELTNQYRKSVIIIGVKSLFEMNKDKEDFYWDQDIYLLFNNYTIGDSSGIALLLAFYSAYYKKPIPKNVAATGAVNNDGSVKMIGGLRQKTICAIKNGIEILVLPEDNYKENLSLTLGYSEKIKKVHPVKTYKDLINLLSQWSS